MKTIAILTAFLTFATSCRPPEKAEVTVNAPQPPAPEKQDNNDQEKEDNSNPPPEKSIDLDLGTKLPFLPDPITDIPVTTAPEEEVPDDKKEKKKEMGVTPIEYCFIDKDDPNDFEIVCASKIVMLSSEGLFRSGESLKIKSGKFGKHIDIYAKVKTDDPYRVIGFIHSHESTIDLLLENAQVVEITVRNGKDLVNGFEKAFADMDLK